MICVCPKCGKKFNSEQQMCEHCGCKIKICSECGNVVEEFSQSCDFCGLEFAMEENIREEKERKATEQAKKEAAILEVYCEKINKKISLIATIAAIAAIILFVVAVAKVFTASFEKLIEQKLSISEYYSQITTLIIFGAIFLVINIVLSNCRHLFSLYFVSKKIKEMNFDIDTYLKTVSLEDLVFDSSKKILIMRYIKEPFYKNSEFWKLVVDVILKIAMIILFCKGAWLIAENYLNAQLWTESFIGGVHPQFKFSLNESLIAGFIVLLGEICFDMFVRNEGGSLTDWIQKQKKKQ